MKPEIKALWVAALRSGEYQQGQNSLRTEDCFCCLGVLCDLAANQGIGEWLETPTFTKPFVTIGDDGKLNREYDDLPVAIQRWADIRRNPIILEHQISTYNDGGDNIRRSFSFAEIADLIEHNL